MARELLEWDQGLGGRGLPEPPPTPERIAQGQPRERQQERQQEHRQKHRQERRQERPASAARPPAPVAPVAAAAKGDETARLTVLAESAASCTECGLHAGRNRSVFARGSHTADIVFVGEGPGYHEDQEGSPFVGKAGQLLDKMIGAMGEGAGEVYICNVVKCRPPDNRTPTSDEAGACKPFLAGQLEIVAPRVIVALGRCAAEHLGCLDEDARGWRGRWSTYEGIPVMPTYHPAFLLRSPNMKRPVWEDLQEVLRRLGKEAPRRGR